jgi:hypothetical protein
MDSPFSGNIGMLEACLWHRPWSSVKMELCCLSIWTKKFLLVLPQFKNKLSNLDEQIIPTKSS